MHLGFVSLLVVVFVVMFFVGLWWFDLVLPKWKD